jgi:hypothetical protein
LIWLDLKHIDALPKDEITAEDQLIYGTLLLRPQHKEFPQDAPSGEHCSQESFASYLDVNPSTVSRLLSRRILTPGLPWRCWVLQYVAYAKGVNAGRKGSGYF